MAGHHPRHLYRRPRWQRWTLRASLVLLPLAATGAIWLALLAAAAGHAAQQPAVTLTMHSVPTLPEASAAPTKTVRPAARPPDVSRETSCTVPLRQVGTIYYAHVTITQGPATLYCGQIGRMLQQCESTIACWGGTGYGVGNGYMCVPDGHQADVVACTWQGSEPATPGGSFIWRRK